MVDSQTQRRRSEDERDIFKDLGASPAPQGEPEDAEQAEYSAHGLAQEKLAIEFYHPDGMITVEFYRHLQSVVCPPPYRLLSLMYMSGVYFLEGRDLHHLIPRISRHRLGELYCIDPDHPALPEEGPVVFAIIRKSLDEIGAELGE